MESLSTDQLNFCLDIIGNIDDDGYLEIPFDEIVARHSSLERDEAVGMLGMVQHLDPVGCGAQNIQELIINEWCISGRNCQFTFADR